MHQVRIKVKEKRQFLRGIGGSLYHFPKYHIQLLLGDFNAKVVRASIFKPTIGNESLHRNSNDYVVR
jgi:hypothetical protein